MKPEKKIRSARPTARLYIKKLNQLFFFAEHQFKKFKKKKKNEFESLNLLANESNFGTCEIHTGHLFTVTASINFNIYLVILNLN